MQNFENIGRELQKQGKTDKLRSLAESADGQRLLGIIDASAVERAAKSGDSAALRDIMSRVLSTAEGQRLAESVRQLMQDGKP